MPLLAALFGLIGGNLGSALRPLLSPETGSGVRVSLGGAWPVRPAVAVRKGMALRS